MSGLLDILTLVAALGCGLVAGVFFAFSTFVMNALAKLPAPQGIAAMQSINVSVITPPFMAALFGTGLVGIAVAVAGAGDHPLLIAGGALYLVGTIVTTLAGNVPLNNTLAALDPASPSAADRWAGYVAGWTAWNHVRTAAALAAAALLIVGLAD